MLPADKMDMDELKTRLLDALRNGRLPISLKGEILGFAAAVKKGRASDKQISMARGLVRETRHLDGTEPVSLVDEDDNEAGREKARNHAEF